MQQQPNMSEQDLLNDMLETEKSLISSYSTYISEASCPNLRRVLSSSFTETTEDQFEVFDNMRKKGYYQTKDAQDQEVQQAKQKFGQMKSELS
jgi:spore coat protein F